MAKPLGKELVLLALDDVVLLVVAVEVVPPHCDKKSTKTPAMAPRPIL